MIWATVSSWFRFCWLYRASPSSTSKNKINLTSVLTIWWCPCVISCVVVRGCLLWPGSSIGKTLLAFPLLHFVIQGQTSLLLHLSLDVLLLISNPLWWEGHLFLVLVLEGVVRLHRTCQLQLLWHQWLGLRLGSQWGWMVCFGNGQASFYLFWDCTQVLHIRLFCWLWGLLHFF